MALLLPGLWRLRRRGNRNFRLRFGPTSEYACYGKPLRGAPRREALEGVLELLLGFALRVAAVESGLEDLGQVYAFVGDAERALDALERAYEERAGSRSVLSMKVNPGYDCIRADPRFVSLSQRVGLAR